MSAVTTLIQNIGDLVNALRTTHSTYKTTSLADVTKVARVEPLTIVSKDCATLEYLPDVMQSLLSIFTGYYLQAVALSTKIDNVKVMKILDRLNPDRDGSAYFAGLESLPVETAKDIREISMESYRFRLPTRAALEADDKLSDPEAGYDTSGTKNLVTVNEMTNMAVGKLVEVEICTHDEKNGDKTFKFPVTIRLAPAVIPNASIQHILTLKTEDNTLVERFHSWRAGRISFIKDLILCQDLIDKHKSALMKDDQGAYSEIIRRANNTKLFGLLTQNPSLVSASNLFVLSEETAREIEQKLGGKLSNPRIRQKAFENTYAMIIVVIDREYERVTFYHRGIAASTDVSLKDIKAANKGSKGGIDIMDVLKSYQMGSAPSF